MFDWDGEELANIIWGEAGENEDHIVPYPDETYEKSPGPFGEHHESANIKLSEKTPVNTHTYDNKCETVSIDGFGPPPNLSLSNATKLDLEHTDEKARVGSGSQASNFVDYGWANVGSFNDFDRILSSNNLVYRNANISCVDSPSVETKSEFIKDPENAPNEKSTSNIVRRTPPLVVYPIGAPNVAMSGEITFGKHTQMGEQRKSLTYQKRKGQICDPWFPSTYQQFHSREEPPAGSSSLMPLSMTPQEKIEKLRRRQQMCALLAIHKQQHEFRHQPTCSNFTPCLNEGQFDENISSFMSLEKSDSDTRSMVMMNTRSLEDTILEQLENVIATLDIQIRVCIRDSLFRLAQSALQRQYAGDTSSTGASNVATSSARTPDGETKTNPIDRAVAHLLFHRPPDLSGELLQSPSSGSRVETESSSRGVTHL